MRSHRQITAMEFAGWKDSHYYDNSCFPITGRVPEKKQRRFHGLTLSLPLYSVCDLTGSSVPKAARIKMKWVTMHTITWLLNGSRGRAWCLLFGLRRSNWICNYNIRQNLSPHYAAYLNFLWTFRVKTHLQQLGWTVISKTQQDTTKCFF